MKWGIAVAMWLAATGCQTARPAPGDGATGSDPFDAELYEAVGAACDPAVSYFCAGYQGLCVDDVCRQQCAASFPACAVGEQRTVVPPGAACICVPE